MALSKTALYKNYEWIDGNEVCRRLAITPGGLQRLVREGGIARQQLPGNRAKYCAADVQTLLAQYTQPARTAR